MKARAPGKVVVSGAYAVLEGAPAIVCAVDRYALADAALHEREPTPEVRAAFGDAGAPACDASALFEGGKKLGLGASAAILVASLAARALVERGLLGDRELAEAVFEAALAAHRRAQGGGSGADVAACAYGGVLVYRSGEQPAIEPAALPSGLVPEVWWSGRPAATSELVARVRSLRERARARYVKLIDAQAAAALDAEVALRRSDADRFVSALETQRQALSALGEAAGVPIVDAAARALGDAAVTLGGAALPAGAGGGDVLLFVARTAAPVEFEGLARRLGYVRMALALGARGVHAVLAEQPEGAA